MTLYRVRDNGPWHVRVLLRGSSVRRSTATTLKPLARQMENMVEALGPKGSRAFDLLDRVADGSLALADLFDAYRKGDLDGLRARLGDVDLSPLVDDYLKQLASKRAKDTPSHYRAILRTLIPAGAPFQRSRFTVAALEAWLADYGKSQGSRRKAHAVASGFSQWLLRKRVLHANPVREIEAPKAGAARTRHEPAEVCARIADAQPAPYREINALLAGSGIEVSVALNLRRRDVNLKTGDVQAAGTKTYCRERVVRVAEWARPYLETACRGKLPDALLFPGLNRWTVSDKHRDACTALEIADYQLKDHRHSYAVRAAQAGTPAEIIARQLGHANAVLVLKVYGRFMPTQSERDKWEQIATAMDAERVKEAQ